MSRTGIIGPDFEHFRDIPPSRVALDLHDDVQRIRDIGFNSRVRYFHTALQDAPSKTRETLSG